MLKRFLSLIAVFVSTCPTIAQVTNETVLRLDQYLMSAHSAYRFNGVAMVFHNGDVLLNKGYGFSNIELQTENNPTTRFPILSITKSFTAIVILKLQEEKRISVNDKISKYFPDYPNGDKIKIHHLLTHSSGIYEYTSDVGIEDSSLVNHPISKEQVIGYFMDKQSDFPPGKHFRYNNSGYFLLGLIIEKITGKPYETVVRELIFNPLDMSASGFDFNSLPTTVKAQGYHVWDNDTAVAYKHYDSTFAYSAGSIYSTSNDMLKWARAVSSRKLLTAKSWDIAFQPKIQNYGYGWEIGQFFGKKDVKHSGGYPGYMSEFIYYPGEDLIILLLNNFGTYGQNVWSIGMGVSSIIFGLPYDDWKIREATTVDLLIAQQHVGVYKGGKTRIEIKLADGCLYSVIPGMPEIKLYAETDNDYYFLEFNTTFNFRGDTLTIHEHGRDATFLKIQ